MFVSMMLGKVKRAQAAALMPALTSGASNDTRNIRGPGPARHQRTGDLQGLQQLQAALQMLQPCTSARADGLRLLHVGQLPDHLAVPDREDHATAPTTETIMLSTACHRAHPESSLLIVSDLAALMECIQSLALLSHGGNPGQMAFVQCRKSRELLRGKVQRHLRRGIQAFQMHAVKQLHHLRTFCNTRGWGHIAAWRASACLRC